MEQFKRLFQQLNKQDREQALAYIASLVEEQSRDKDSSNE